MAKLDPERWRAVGPHLDRVLDMPPGERVAWLSSMRAHDPALAADLEALLHEHRLLAQEGFLDQSFPMPAAGKTDQDPPASSTPRVGMTLGRYKLVRKVGEGGMGIVFEGIHQDLGRRAAIKTLHRRYANSKQARLRFLREGQAASRIRHPNVADVYDVSTDEDHPFLVIELLEGEDLSHLLAREGPLSEERTADLMLPVIAAVAAAHEQGVVHRDLKPENIFLSREGNGVRPKVLDFGISKVIDVDGFPSLTDTGTFLGTPFYVSPEQARGAKIVDARSDQYSLGVILYECVTGQRPIENCSIYSWLHKIAVGDFLPPREVNRKLPSTFEKLILRAMSLDPDDRFETTADLANGLLDFASHNVRLFHGDNRVAPVLCTFGEGNRPSFEVPTSPASEEVGNTTSLPQPHSASNGERRGEAIFSFERPNTSGAHIRGSLFAHIPQFVQEYFGRERWMEFLRQLDPVANEAFSSQMQALAWYPFRVIASAVDVIMDMSGPRRAEETLIRLARHNLDSATTLIFRAIFKMGSPEFMVSRSAQVWKRYYSSGRMRVIHAEAGRACVQLLDFPEVTANYNRGVLYGIGAVIAKAGGRLTRQEITRDTHRGDELNEYTYTWR